MHSLQSATPHCTDCTVIYYTALHCNILHRTALHPPPPTLSSCVTPILLLNFNRELKRFTVLSFKILFDWFYHILLYVVELVTSLPHLLSPTISPSPSLSHLLFLTISSSPSHPHLLLLCISPSPSLPHLLVFTISSTPSLPHLLLLCIFSSKY